MEPVTSVCGKAMVLSILFVQLGVCRFGLDEFHRVSISPLQRLKTQPTSVSKGILHAPARYNRLRRDGASVALCVWLRHGRLPGEFRRKII